MEKSLRSEEMRNRYLQICLKFSLKLFAIAYFAFYRFSGRSHSS